MKVSEDDVLFGWEYATNKLFGNEGTENDVHG